MHLYCLEKPEHFVAGQLYRCVRQSALFHVPVTCPPAPNPIQGASQPGRIWKPVYLKHKSLVMFLKYTKLVKDEIGDLTTGIYRNQNEALLFLGPEGEHLYYLITERTTAAHHHFILNSKFESAKNIRAQLAEVREQLSEPVSTSQQYSKILAARALGEPWAAPKKEKVKEYRKLQKAIQEARMDYYSMQRCPGPISYTDQLEAEQKLNEAEKNMQIFKEKYRFKEPA